MRSRNLLHIKKFKSFLSYALETGWTSEPHYPPYEVKRLRKGNRLAIIHQRDPKKGKQQEHYTVWGDSLDLTLEWMEYKK